VSRGCRWPASYLDEAGRQSTWVPWFAGDLPDIHSKDARLQLAGRRIIEIAEPKAMRSSELEAQKSCLTQTRGTFRPPYGRRTALKTDWTNVVARQSSTSGLPG
jgi:hypothetical protein